MKLKFFRMNTYVSVHSKRLNATEPLEPKSSPGGPHLGLAHVALSERQPPLLVSYLLPKGASCSLSVSIRSSIQTPTSSPTGGSTRRTPDISIPTSSLVAACSTKPCWPCSSTS